jgi:DNA-binding beta-propeller fold protein YncE
VISRGFLTAALAAVLLGAGRPAPLTIYSAPAAQRPAGASAERATDAVLPDGRIAAPLGNSVFVGTNPLGVAISPDGRYAIVANAQDHGGAELIAPPSSPRVISGYSLAVVDTSTMEVASTYSDPSLAVYSGIAALPDPSDRTQTLVVGVDGPHNAVRFFALSEGGTLRSLAQLPVPGYPASLAISQDGRDAYVTSELGNRVTSIDLATRTVTQHASTGFFPFGVAGSSGEILVANGGLASYRALPQPQAAPDFRAPSSDPERSSSLTVSGGTTVRLDPVPDGVQAVGGARPSSVIVRHHGEYAYVTLANVDRVSIVALAGEPHVVAGLDLRLFSNAPYGTQPGAEVLSRDDKRLYVALAGLNAVAILDASDPAKLHRLGLIPTGSDPSALALSPDGRYLYITAAQGVDGWGELQRVDLRKLPLQPATLSALRYTRAVAAAKPNTVVPPLRSLRKSSVIDRVVYISVGDVSYDAVFGGDSGNASTPNIRALASTYALADNFYLEHSSHGLNEATALGGEPTLYALRVSPVALGRAPLDDRGADPEDYPRSGYLFNALARANLSYRDYGGLMQLSGYRASAPAAASPRGRGRGPAPTPAPLTGLGGVYTMDVPALAALGGHTDLNYPGWNPDISNDARAGEFIADMGKLVDAEQQPAFSYVWLPDTQGMSDADRAVGRIVEFLSHTPHWSSTAVFIVGDALADPRDHVNRARSFAIVVSPLAKPHFIGHAHVSTASVLKTEEELFGLPPLSLADLLAGDLAEFFGQVPYPSAYQAIP